MYISVQRQKADPWVGERIDLAERRPPVQPTARSEHARLLTVAAARRLRSKERAGLGRLDDALYWKEVAPVALSKAARLRRDGLPALPA